MPIKPGLITIDGPSGAGKGTIARNICERTGWNLLDSGALYRLLALSALEKKIALDNAPALAECGRKLDVSFELAAGEDHKVMLNGVQVDTQMRTEAIGNTASKLAALVAVRQALLARQRDFLSAPGLVADGRDMGTVVFPEAQCKVYLTASAEERAERRYKQLCNKGIAANMGDLLSMIRERDERDMNRKVAPLIAAEDAMTIDATHLTIAEVVAKVIDFMGVRGLL